MKREMNDIKDMLTDPGFWLLMFLGLLFAFGGASLALWAFK